MDSNLNSLLKKSINDGIVCATVSSVLLISIVISLGFSYVIGLGIIIFFSAGCTAAFLALKHHEVVSLYMTKLKNLFRSSDTVDFSPSSCDVCGVTKCPRHRVGINQDAWKLFEVDKDLDQAVAKFYDFIVDNFISNWFTEFSGNMEFIYLVKMIIREATCRLVVQLKELNLPVLITDKLLPCVFSHYETVDQMIRKDNIPLSKLTTTFATGNNPIHPAVINRQTEINYLRELSKFLIPRLFRNDCQESKLFSTLIREILTLWVLLPLMDVISDPGLINLLVEVATDPKSSHDNYSRLNKNREKVRFLERFTQKFEMEETGTEDGSGGGRDIDDDDDFLTDPRILYVFMQYLKREGSGLEILNFYLDVESLNVELLDPKVTTDPTKLSSLQQKSEKLLETYGKMKAVDSCLEPATTLTEANANIKKVLVKKWRPEFYKTIGYFELQYGNGQEADELDGGQKDLAGGAVSRISSKIKGAIRGAIDGAPIEAIEMPTVWDGLPEPQLSTVNLSIGGQKIKKERGQNLDMFMATLMQSIEQSTDVGEDVAENVEEEIVHPMEPPINNVVFGDLFGMRYHKTQSVTLNHGGKIKGPSQCLIYILVQIIRAPIVLVRMVLASIAISRRFVDSGICKLISKLIRAGLYEPRLAHAIDLLRELLIERPPGPTAQELLDRQKLAKVRLNEIRSGLGDVLDVIQTPSLNKHLMYCLFDIILIEVFPELINHIPSHLRGQRLD